MGVKGKTSIFVSQGNCVSPAGATIEENLVSIENKHSAISMIDDASIYHEPFYAAMINQDTLNTWCANHQIPASFTKFEQLILLALAPEIKKYSPYFKEQCAFILSSTKGNIDDLNPQNSDYLLTRSAKKIAAEIGIQTEPIVLSNACVSGAMAISVAKRLIESKAYKHVLIAAGDVFSSFVFSGFQSFHALSSRPCKPYSKWRDGITLGEAAAAIFVSSDAQAFGEPDFEILGDSSINDANHISGPSRTGEGLHLSIENALREAGISAQEIDCVSAHGTATEYNDEMEAQAFNRSGLHNTPVFSLKGFYGHTLGAAGLLETVVTLALAKENRVPQSFGYDEHGLTLPLNIVEETQSMRIQKVLKTASGFGGVNTALVFNKCKVEAHAD